MGQVAQGPPRPLTAPQAPVRECGALMLGLDNAGKTTVLQHLSSGRTDETVPTMGFNVGRITHRDLGLTIWDVGGHNLLRQLWKHHFQGAHVLIYVVDSNDQRRLEEACNELHEVLAAAKVSNLPLLILANKQDLSGALRPGQIARHLGLPAITGPEGPSGGPWAVIETVATRGAGLLCALDWLRRRVHELPEAHDSEGAKSSPCKAVSREKQFSAMSWMRTAIGLQAM